MPRACRRESRQLDRLLRGKGRKKREEERERERRAAVSSIRRASSRARRAAKDVEGERRASSTASLRREETSGAYTERVLARRRMPARHRRRRLLCGGRSAAETRPDPAPGSPSRRGTAESCDPQHRREAEIDCPRRKRRPRGALALRVTHGSRDRLGKAADT